MTTDLDQAVYALLTPARWIIDQHRNDGHHQCSWCGEPWPCFDLSTAIEALDLVLRIHTMARRGKNPTATRVARPCPTPATDTDHR